MMSCATCGYHRDLHEPITLKCPGEARGKFRDPPPIDTATYAQIIRRDVEARFAAIEAARAPYVPDVVLPPQVPARPPQGPGELARYGGKQALGLGRSGVDRGWAVDALYWRAHDGTEGCAVRLARDDLRAVATWTRKPGQIGKPSGWAADVAYGWRLGTMPIKINHTELERFVNDDDAT
jgi:hypothetical protein